MQVRVVLFAAMVIVGVVGVLGSPMPVRADVATDIGGQLDAAATRTDIASYRDVRVVVARIINAALTLIGAIFVALMVYAGFLWMTAAGNADHVEKAQTTLRNAAIGVVLVLIAYGIAQFVIQALEKATKGT